jgi:hypothetical protein
MATVLITFGDSWTDGAELTREGEMPYGNILSEYLGVDYFYNYAQSGSSNEHLLYQFQDYITHGKQEDHTEITAVFHLTTPTRTAHLPGQQDFNLYGEVIKKWPSEIKDFYKQAFLHFTRPEHEIMRYSSTVGALQQWCKQLNIRDYYFSCWVRYPTWLPGVDTSKIWKQGQETASDWFGCDYKNNGEVLAGIHENQYVYPNQNHANQLGHQLIAERLYQWIREQP